MRTTKRTAPSPPAALFDVAPFDIGLPERRLSIEPLLARFGSASALAFAAHVSERQVLRWRTDGVDFIHADEIAIECGENPEDVWRDEWFKNDREVEADD